MTDVKLNLWNGGCSREKVTVGQGAIVNCVPVCSLSDLPAHCTKRVYIYILICTS